MKNLTKLALVSAMAISANAMAAQLQSLDDAELSAATGQDGITITLGSGVSFDYLAINDADGVGSLASTDIGIPTASAGVLVLGHGTGFSLANTGLDVVIDADGADGGTLNINLDFGATTLNVGDIKVGARNASGTDFGNFDGASLNTALSIGTINLDGLEVNLQLGAQPQGALIKVDSNITGGLNLASLDIVGANGTIGITNLNVSTVGATVPGDLELQLDIDATANGLTIDGLGSLNVSMDTLHLGNGTSIGATYISNLDVGTVTIAGH